NESRVATFWFGGSWTEKEFTFLRGKFDGVQSVAAYRQGDATLSMDNAPLRLIPGVSASGELFDVLGARPMLGRAIRVGDDVSGAEPVAVLSNGLWQELGAKPSIIGTRMM